MDEKVIDSGINIQHMLKAADALMLIAMVFDGKRAEIEKVAARQLKKAAKELDFWLTQIAERGLGDMPRVPPHSEFIK